MTVAFPLTAVRPGMTGFGQNQNPEVGSVFSKTGREGQALSATRGISQAARKVADIPAYKAPDESAGAATRWKLSFRQVEHDQCQGTAASRGIDTYLARPGCFTRQVLHAAHTAASCVWKKAAFAHVSVPFYNRKGTCCRWLVRL